MSQLSQEGSENRKFQRFDVDCRVRIACMRDGQRNVTFGRATNISIGGMLLIAPMELNEGERIQLEFNLAGFSEPTRISAIVRHKISTYSYGVEFRDIGESQRHSIFRMLEVLNVLK